MESCNLSGVVRLYEAKKSRHKQCKMGEIQPFMCKTAKQDFVGHKSLTAASQSKILELLYCNVALAKNNGW